MLSVILLCENKIKTGKNCNYFPGFSDRDSLPNFLINKSIELLSTPEGAGVS